MKLREEIEPKIIQIEKICPQISRLLRGYDSEKDNKCLNIIKKISELTHKVITKDILSEYMEDDSICMVALRLSIGTPPLLHIPLSCDELLEIIQRIHSKNYVEYKVKMNFGGFCHTIIMFRYWKKTWNYQNLRLFVKCYIKKLYLTVCGISRKKYLKKF